MSEKPSPQPKPNPGKSSSTGNVDEQHASINQMLSKLETTTNLPEVSQQLNLLRTLLEEHFQTEESEEGLHHLVTELAPRHIPHVERLIAEHQHLIKDLQKIQDDIVDILECRTQQVCSDVSAFAHKLREHEKQEDLIFDDALYRETGGHQ